MTLEILRGLIGREVTIRSLQQKGVIKFFTPHFEVGVVLSNGDTKVLSPDQVNSANIIVIE